MISEFSIRKYYFRVWPEKDETGASILDILDDWMGYYNNDRR